MKFVYSRQSCSLQTSVLNSFSAEQASSAPTAPLRQVLVQVFSPPQHVAEQTSSSVIEQSSTKRQAACTLIYRLKSLLHTTLIWLSGDLCSLPLSMIWITTRLR